MDIAGFVAARLDEDEQAALAAESGHGPWEWQDGGYEGGEQLRDERTGFYEVEVFPDRGGSTIVAQTWPHETGAANARHIARHDPSRVLAEVEAKRAILAEHSNLNAELDPEHWACARCQDRHRHDAMTWPCATLRALAAVYAGHPGYDPAWHPADL